MAEMGFFLIERKSDVTLSFKRLPLGAECTTAWWRGRQRNIEAVLIFQMCMALAAPKWWMWRYKKYLISTFFFFKVKADQIFQCGGITCLQSFFLLHLERWKCHQLIWGSLVRGLFSENIRNWVKPQILQWLPSVGDKWMADHIDLE